MGEEVRVGLLGLGTVGEGVAYIIQHHKEKLQHQVGRPIIIEKVLVQNKQKKRSVELDPAIFTEDVNDVLNNDKIDVVIEVMGGVESTREHLLTALKNGKHVVTANKDLIALHGAELTQVASENGCDLYYEASVGGGIPILRGLNDGLSADHITKIMGIVNGTTNYILTKMSQEGSSYDDVLKQAQALGFAESDPTADVEGLDAARKMTILTNLGFSTAAKLEDVSVRGISSVTQEDLEYCKQLGYTMKLIGLAKRDEGRVEISVEPTLLPNEHPLASVHNEYNAVYVYGDAVGETMFYGPGAGSLPTASAVMADLVAVVKNMRLGVSGQSAQDPLYDCVLKVPKEIAAKYFLRLHVVDRAGAFQALTKVFADYEVSFEKLLQLPINSSGIAEVIIVTHVTNKEEFEQIYTDLTDLDVIDSIESCYRVEGGY